MDIPGETLLPRVHEILQTVMGWENYHLHDFRAEGATYGVPSPGDDFLPIVDEHDVSLHVLVARHRPHFAYFYDYGDGWEHDVVAEEIPNAKTTGLPRCVAGARACPPEDVGGPHAYQTYLEALRDALHPQHEEYLGWRGPFDPEQFNLAKINKALRSKSKSRRQTNE